MDWTMILEFAFNWLLFPAYVALCIFITGPRVDYAIKQVVLKAIERKEKSLGAKRTD